MSVKKDSYINIQAFMVNDLHLGGNELIIYACIFGFSQDGESWFTGSRAYLASWCQASKSTVSRNLEKLCKAGLIEKRIRNENGVTLVDYRATRYTQNADGYTQNEHGGIPKMGTGGIPKMRTHNIDIDNLEENTRDSRRFTPPSIEEVRAYCIERQNNVNPQRFVDHYESNGWMVGRNKMKDWRAAVRTWESNGIGKQQPKPKPERRPAKNVEEIMACWGLDREVAKMAFDRKDDIFSYVKEG